MAFSIQHRHGGHGAYALGIPAGALTPGRLADLVLVRLDRFHLQPAVPETILPNLVHAARGSDVDLVIVGGQIVMEGGTVRAVDEASVRARAAAIGASLLAAPPPSCASPNGESGPRGLWPRRLSCVLSTTDRRRCRGVRRGAAARPAGGRRKYSASGDEGDGGERNEEGGGALLG